jgi:hypothetical protein
LEAFVSWVQLETWPRDMLVKIVAEELLGRFPDPVSLEAYRTEAGRAVDLRLREVTEKDA